MALSILSFLGSVVSPVVGLFKERAERKRIKQEGKQRIEEAVVKAKVRRLDQALEGDISWQNLSIKNSGWKDEWFTIVLSIPAILCFIPNCAPLVHQGFEALAKAPPWYRWCLITAVASSFGYKKLADFMALKKGGRG